MILVVTDSQGFTCKLFSYWEHLKVKLRKFLGIHKVCKMHETHNKHLFFSFPNKHLEKKKRYTKLSHIQTHCSLDKSSKFMLASQKINGRYQETIFKFVVYLEQNIDLRKMLSLRGFILTC